jgi:glutathione S-transferase
MLRVYDSRLSGNAWKVRILLNQLGRPFERVTLDLEEGETASPAFRKLSRFARIPVLELEDGRTIVESGAILLYLAQGTPYLPDDAYLRAEVTSWLFFEQGDLQRAIALPRVYHLRGLAASMTQEIERYQRDGYAGLEKLEQWLRGREWLVGERYTIADIALFAYVSMATEGGYDMERFDSIRQWISRVKSQPGWTDLLHSGPPISATTPGQPLFPPLR